MEGIALPRLPTHRQLCRTQQVTTVCLQALAQDRNQGKHARAVDTGKLRANLTLETNT